MKNIAVILLHDEKKRFLLQHRTSDAPKFPGRYGFFGGEAEEKETPEMAVKRECYEEIEYELKNPKLLLNTIINDEYGKRNVHVFLEKYDPEKKLVLNEGCAMKWATKEEVRNLKIVDYQVDILKDMYNKI